MSYVPTDKLTEIIPNKYEAILVVARDARIQNSIQQLQDLDPDLPTRKMTSVSIDRLLAGKVEYYYAEDTPEELEEEDLEEDDD